MEEKDIKKQNKETKQSKKIEKVIEQPKQELADKPYYERIEDERKAFYGSFITNRRISYILMFITLVIAAGVMFMLTRDKEKYPYFQYIGWAVAGVSLVAMLIYFFTTKKKQPEKGKKYISSVVKQMNDRAFRDSAFSDMIFDEQQKITLEDLVGDGIYKDASGIRSRNVVKGIYNGHHFLYGEAALMRIQTNRKQQTPPLFVGKYISMPNELDFNGRIIIVNKNAKQPVDLPNDIEDLEILEEKENFVVYGPKDMGFRKYLRKEIVASIETINLDAHLLNLNVVFWKGHSAAYLSYDDDLMSIPFEKAFDHVAFEKSVDDAMVIFKALAGK